MKQYNNSFDKTYKNLFVPNAAMVSAAAGRGHKRKHL